VPFLDIIEIGTEVIEMLSFFMEIESQAISNTITNKTTSKGIQSKREQSPGS